MTNQRSGLRPVLYLTLAGLLSSLLILWSPRLFVGVLGMFGIGVTFGVVLAVCFCLCFGVRSPWKLAGFVITSAAAYPLSLFSLGPGPLAYLMFPLTHLALSVARVLGSGHTPQGQLDPAFPFGPGFVGAFLVLAAGLFAISSRNQSSKRLLLKALIGALVGGVLGVVGYVLGPSLGLVLWKLMRAPGGPMSSAASQNALARGDTDFYSLYVVWQTGVALLLGLLWWHGEARVAVSAPAESPETASVPAPKERIPLAAKLFFIGGTVLLLYFVGRIARNSYSTARTQREIAQSIAEAPSRENLPPVKPETIDQALLLHSIPGYLVLNSYDSYRPPFNRILPHTANGVSRAWYTATYVKVKSGVTIAGRPDVEVTLSEFPNSVWARYQLRNTPVPNAAYLYAKYRRKVEKFGNWVVQDSGRVKTTGEVLFYWWSGNNLIAVHFYKAEEDEFLKAYLQKYPSDVHP